MPSQPKAPSARGLVTIAVNPAAARASTALTESVRRAARSAGHEVELTVAESAAHMADLARVAAERRDDAFVCLGGDGSVGVAAGALAGSTVPLVIVPTGTGNLLATGLGHPRSPAAVGRLLREGRPRVIDLGVLETGGETRIFTVAAGIGFDAAVMAATPRRVKRRLGQIGYLGTAIAKGLSIPQSRFRIATPDGEFEATAAVVLAANCLDRVLGVLRPAVPIDASDGRLELFVVPGSNGVSLLRSIAQLLRAGPSKRSVRGGAVRLCVAEARVTATPAQPIELDGDPFAAASTLTLRVMPSALTVLTRG